MDDSGVQSEIVSMGAWEEKLHGCLGAWEENKDHRTRRHGDTGTRSKNKENASNL